VSLDCSAVRREGTDPGRRSVLRARYARNLNTAGLKRSGGAADAPREARSINPVTSRSDVQSDDQLGFGQAVSGPSGPGERGECRPPRCAVPNDLFAPVAGTAWPASDLNFDC
jgi:hypothetical protein